MKSIGLPDDAHKKIKIISANTGKSIKDLILECLQILEEKYGRDNKERK